MSDWTAYLRPNVYLRDVAFSDLGDFFDLEHGRSPPIGAAKPRRKELIAYCAQWISSLMDVASVNRTLVWNNEIAGYVRCSNMTDQPALQLFIGQPHRRQGLGLQALRETLRHVLTRPILAKADMGNLPAIRLLERCGFERCQTDNIVVHDPEELVFELQRHSPAPAPCPDLPGYWP